VQPFRLGSGVVTVEEEYLGQGKQVDSDQGQFPPGGADDKQAGRRGRCSSNTRHDSLHELVRAVQHRRRSHHVSAKWHPFTSPRLADARPGHSRRRSVIQDRGALGWRRASDMVALFRPDVRDWWAWQDTTAAHWAGTVANVGDL
jgi:hypothetical protein